jgi:predicted nucleic acid-binding protein
MNVAIDTNILFDILLPDSQFLDHALAKLKSSGKKGRLIISEIVYAELASQFSEEVTLSGFLSDTDIDLVNSDSRALWYAARAWKKYTRARGRELQCPACGKLQGLSCSECSKEIAYRQHIIADFIVGGHALSHAGALLTRDRGYYSHYFPELKLL